MKIPEYFTDKELSCRCGCGLMPPQEAVERLYALRMILRVPLPITSGARCHKHNKATPGASTGSIHLPAASRRGRSAEWGGGAFDIVANDGLKIKIIDAALRCGFRGFVVGVNYIHVDDAARPELMMRWCA